MVQFATTRSEKSNLLPELKDSSIDFVLLKFQGLAEPEWNEYLSSIIRVLKPGGKLLTVGPMGHIGAE
jgi:ubiquinone/menaquinone biosynthesis C-methylase UbiE